MSLIPFFWHLGLGLGMSQMDMIVESKVRDWQTTVT